MPQTCCPIGNIYIDIAGHYDDVGFGTGTVVNPPGIAGCIRPGINAAGQVMVLGEPSSPLDCPCCPVGYRYSSFKHVCMTTSVPYQVAEPVPCITCVCPDPDPFVCEECEGSAGVHIAFRFNFHRRNCVDCEPQNDEGPTGPIECFIPGNYLDPIIANFRLNNKNFI
jgi:hypothetical protein